MGKVRPREKQKLLISLKVEKACGLDGIPDECPKHLPTTPLVYLTLPSAVPYSKAFKESYIYNFTESGQR
jgi:hypothetical protein